MMDAYSIVQLLAWVAVGAVMLLTAATMCFDFGAGMLARFVGRNDAEKRVMINTVAPTWDGNQVWLIIAGAGLFAIWPRVYSASFSGMYLGVLVVLWGLFLRPVSFEYRHLHPAGTWKNFWDWGLCLGSLIPILVMGVAIGNLFLGLPFTFDPDTLRFFYGHQGMSGPEPAFLSLIKLLTPFPLLIGVFAVVMSLMHGASYSAMRTTGRLYERLARIQRICALLFIILFAAGGIWLCFLQGYHWTPARLLDSYSDAVYHPLNGAQVTLSEGGWLTNYAIYPWMVLAPLAGFAGALLVMISSSKQRPVAAFSSSVLAVAGAVLTMGFSLFPFVMPSSLAPDQSLVLWNASSSMNSLMGILIVAAIMLPIIFTYTTFVYKKMWGRNVKMTPEEIEQRKHELY